MKTNKTIMKQILDYLANNPVGEKINISACKVKKNKIKIHCWDGERYVLDLSLKKED